ncbi:hypothetical protein SS50377_25541 [Spironucleus salmonicida]|uniref:Uncharacterized protein n=1 Tax=Spironucleus salmonicida TaxID=348837 RepID=V6LWA0_9EUKA|nr:hypothetical protein SS50377_25541 [Spironucleus salmonicida]|eukprot:EST45089.1 Hypothetical protein SS50377_15109 [Spironucleus salmonicida]
MIAGIHLHVINPSRYTILTIDPRFQQLSFDTYTQGKDTLGISTVPPVLNFDGSTYFVRCYLVALSVYLEN